MFAQTLAHLFGKSTAVCIKGHHCHFSLHLRDGQIWCCRFRLLWRAKHLRDLLFAHPTPTAALTGGIQLISTWFRKASRSTSFLQPNPSATHTEVLSLHTAPPFPQERTFPCPRPPEPGAASLKSDGSPAPYLKLTAHCMHKYSCPYKIPSE